MKRPVLLNNWEGTYFDFDEAKLLEIEDAAASLNCEMFVLDDGWFGARNSDRAGLGDWKVNRNKLPGGLKAVADHARELGLKFGLWIEPEMINEDSDLCREHPEWVLKEPGRKPVVSRSQLVLDMGRREVVDHLFGCISDILDSADISYIKWDFNRAVSNPYSNALPADRQGEVYHRFILGTYMLLERLTKAYPDVMIEGCAGGGGRFDAGMLFYTPQIWCSDNSEPVNRLKIQKGTSYGYPVCTMGAHVSASPNHQNGREVPLETRGVVAMSGTFGYELDPSKLSEEEKDVIRRQIADFNRYYELIQRGRYYRLTDSYDEEYFNAWMFVSDDGKEALLNLVVTDVRGNPEIPYVRLKGLDPDAVYEVKDSAIYANVPEWMPEEDEEKSSQAYSGRALMNGGYTFAPLFGVYPSAQIHFVRIG